MKFLILLLFFTLNAFAVTTVNNNAVIGKTLTVNNKYVSGNSFISGEFEGSTDSWFVAHSEISSVTPTSTTTAGTALSVGSGLTTATSLTFTATNSNPISGSYSGLLTASATSTAGDLLISPAISIPNSAKAKMITIGFSYSASSAINLSGTASNSFAVYVYDIDNATWIQPAGTYGMIDGSTYAQVKNITFQTSSNGTKYQLAIVNINSIASYTLKIDEVYFGTQPYSSGAAMSDWKSFTPSIKGSTTDPTIPTATIKNISGYYRRVGDSAEICENFYFDGTVSGGAAGSGIYLFTLPSELRIDLNKVTYYSADPSSPTAIGSASTYSSSAAPYGRHSGFVKVYNSQYLTITSGSGGAGAAAAGLDQISSSWGQIEASATKVYNFCAIVPIVGWSSNTVQSADSDTRVTSLKLSGVTSAPFGTSFATAGNIVSTVIKDSHGAYNTGVYTVPSSGDYSINVLSQSNGTVSTNATIYFVAAVNGVESSQIRALTTANTLYINGTMDLPNLKAGDIITTRVYVAGGTFSGATLVALEESIKKLSGPAVVQASESVSASYSNTAGPTIPTGGAFFGYPTKAYDSHNAYNSSTGYTIPVSGSYLVSASYCSLSAAVTSCGIDLIKGGVVFATSNLSRLVATNSDICPTVTGIVNAKQGEIIGTQDWCTTSGQVMVTGVGKNTFTITRVGN